MRRDLEEDIHHGVSDEPLPDVGQEADIGHDHGETRETKKGRFIHYCIQF